MNVARLVELADAIEQSGSYDQGEWMNSCGSPACVAGHAVFLWPEEANLHYYGTDYKSLHPITFEELVRRVHNGDSEIINYVGGWHGSAAQILDIEDQSYELFTGFPEALYGYEEDGEVITITADHAAYTIRLLIETGEVDWRAYLEEQNAR